MNKILIGVLSLALVGTGGLVAAVDGFGGEPLRSVSLLGASTDATTAAATTTGTTTEAAEDISGPCDEAEHANDPRCTGAGEDRDDDGDDARDDNSGPGSGRDDGHHNDDDDNSGPGSESSGPGSADRDDD